MRRGEGAMARRMPILGQDDMIEAFGKAIDDRNHAIAVGNRQRTAGAEIVLHVDNQQQIIVGLDPHFTTWARDGAMFLKSFGRAAGLIRPPACHRCFGSGYFIAS